MALSMNLAEQAYAAFSPTKLSVARTTGDPTDVDITIADEAAVEITTLNVEIFNNATSVDLSNIMKFLFTETLTEIGSNAIAKVYEDFRLHKPFGIRIPDYSAGFYLKYTAVNAVLTPGVIETSFRTLWENKVLTKFSKIYWWPGYTEYSCLSMLVGFYNTVLNIVGASSTVSRTVHKTDITFARVITLNTNPGLIPLRLDLVAATTSSKLVEEKCIPENPCFIRWINEVGGWDHWMFSGKQDHGVEIADQVIFQRRVDSNLDTATNSHTVSGTRADSIKVGTQGVLSVDMDALVSLAVSPRIQIYDVINNVWNTVINDGSKPTWDSNETKHTVEFQFILPTKNMQHV